jgi:hypothetical protein
VGVFSNQASKFTVSISRRSCRCGTKSPRRRTLPNKLVTLGWGDAVLVATPISILVAHGLLFGSWIVDDAGISFAYARNLANGYGLVAQPGLVPVEGYSNPLWVLILVPFFWVANGFDAVVVPKLLALMGVAAGFIAYYRAAALQLPGGRQIAVAGLSLAAMQSGLVIWCVSGLENGLYVFLLLLLATIISSPGSNQGVAAGLTAAAVAMTRPEGVVFSLAYPVMARWKHPVEGGVLKALRQYAAGLVPPLGAFLVFRMYYFGDLLPNTYYAKGGPTWRSISEGAFLDFQVIRAAGDDLAAATIGIRAGVVLLVLAAWSVFFWWRSRKENPLFVAVSILLGLSVGVYILLPFDWMPEYRFATPFFIFFYLWVGHVAWCAAKRIRALSAHCGVSFAVIVVAVGILTACVAIPRSLAFVRHPVIPLAEVIETARRFERLASIAEAQNPSVMMADVGGALFAGRLRIYDLGMLSDRTIAKALGEGAGVQDRATFYDYVFETARPTFIATRAYHSWLARLDADPRFRRDYVAIVEYSDEWIVERYRVVLQSGDFVRREVVVEGGAEMLAKLREAVSGTHYVGCGTCE